MKLTATVIATHSASEAADGKPRVTLKAEGADWTDNKLKLPNSEGYALDQELVLLVLTKEQAAELLRDLRDGFITDRIKQFADQLRPDEPPPLEITQTEAAHA